MQYINSIWKGSYSREFQIAKVVLHSTNVGYWTQHQQGKTHRNAGDATNCVALVTDSHHSGYYSCENISFEAVPSYTLHICECSRDRVNHYESAVSSFINNHITFSVKSHDHQYSLGVIIATGNAKFALSTTLGVDKLHMPQNNQWICFSFQFKFDDTSFGHRNNQQRTCKKYIVGSPWDTNYIWHSEIQTDKTFHQITKWLFLLWTFTRQISHMDKKMELCQSQKLSPQTLCSISQICRCFWWKYEGWFSNG